MLIFNPQIRFIPVRRIGIVSHHSKKYVKLIDYGRLAGWKPVVNQRLPDLKGVQP